MATNRWDLSFSKFIAISRFFEMNFKLDFTMACVESSIAFSSFFFPSLNIVANLVWRERDDRGVMRILRSKGATREEGGRLNERSNT